jgi:hypothetical protein
MTMPDREALSKLNLADVEAYLRSMGWAENDPYYGGRWWRKTDERTGEYYEVLVPNSVLSDYAELIGDLLGRVARVEKRGPGDVYASFESSHSEKAK